jgi:hypothetical protein
MGKRAAPVSSFPKVKATAKAKTQAQPKLRVEKRRMNYHLNPISDRS